MGLLQIASFRGVPFKVVAAQVKKGRRWAIHEYPYVDGGWPEDLGRTLRAYSFSGYLIGALAPVMQNLLDNAIETEGPGLLIHPTIGAVRVGLISASSSVHRDRMRVIEVQFEFVEAGDGLFPLAIIATVVSVLAAAAAILILAFWRILECCMLGWGDLLSCFSIRAGAVAAVKTSMFPSIRPRCRTRETPRSSPAG